MPRPSSSGYQGVCWNKPVKKWAARYTLPGTGRVVHVGHFDTPHEAAIARAEALIEREQDLIRSARQRLALYTK